MTKLSPKYRNDPSDGLDVQLKERLDREFFGTLENVEHINPKMVVVFAGGNAVGKSTLSVRLMSELHGIRLENDGVKRAILKHQPELAMTDQLHRMVWQYTMDLYKRLDTLTQNGLVIRDGVIQWYFDRILPIFVERGYRIFIIGYDLSEAKMRELIRARGNTDTSTEERFYQLIPDQKIHLKRFFEQYQADIMLHDDTLFDHDAVVAAVRNALAEITL